jgi:hypothetical protein
MLSVFWGLPYAGLLHPGSPPIARLELTDQTLRCTLVDKSGYAGWLARRLQVPDLKKRLTETFEDMSKTRAEVIARTETQNAYNRSSALSYQESGEVDEVELHDNPDHADDPMGPTNTTCAERDGLIVVLSGVGDYIDSAHPNCQLGISPILRTALGEE